MGGKKESKETSKPNPREMCQTSWAAELLKRAGAPSRGTGPGQRLITFFPSRNGKSRTVIRGEGKHIKKQGELHSEDGYREGGGWQPGFIYHSHNAPRHPCTSRVERTKHNVGNRKAVRTKFASGRHQEGG